MSSLELLQLITRKSSSFRTVNLKREFTFDPFSGSKTIRKSDPGFLTHHSVGVSLKDGRLTVHKKKAHRVKGKKNQKTSKKHEQVTQ